MAWSRRWLGLEDTDAEERSTQKPGAQSARTQCSPTPYPKHCQKAWQSARPIRGTRGEAYLGGRGLGLNDPRGAVLRYAKQHPRRNSAGDLEHHPALLALLSDIRTGQPAGLINIYLQPDGTDRLRDPRGKTSWGRAGGSAVMLSTFSVGRMASERPSLIRSRRLMSTTF